MTDIVARLRDWPRMTPAACKEAADEIERLTAENELLQTAPDGYLNKDDLIADLRNENDNLHEMNAKLHAEIERLRGLLNDEQYIRLKADYNKGHLSHAGWLQAREQKHD